MKNIYAVLGFTVVTAATFLAGAGWMVVNMAEMGAINTDSKLGEQLIDLAEAIYCKKNKKDMNDHGLLS
jgi:hypothetical protein